MKYVYRLAIIMGIGAACHAMLYSDTFNPSNMWSWAYLLAWPIMLIAHAFKWIVWAIVAIVTCVCLWLLYEKADDIWWAIQRQRAMRKAEALKAKAAQRPNTPPTSPRKV